MTELVPFLAYDWSVRHGDSASTPPVALLTGDGDEVDLTEWTVRAQVRDKAGALLHTFVRGTGIVTGRGSASFADDREPIETATVRLRLVPDDFAHLDRKLRGAAYDVEVSRGATVRTVMGGALEVIGDVTRE